MAINEHKVGYARNGQIEVHVPKERYDDRERTYLAKLIGRRETGELFEPSSIGVVLYGR